MKRHTFVIQTKYHGPTNTRGARISARFTVGNLKSVFIDYPYHAGGGEIAHKEAVNALMLKHKSTGKNTCTHYAEYDQGYLFCFE